MCYPETFAHTRATKKTKELFLLNYCSIVGFSLFLNTANQLYPQK